MCECVCVCNWIKLTENNKAEEGAATEKNKQKRCQLKNFVFGYSHRQRTRTANRKGWLDREKDKVSKREREGERGGEYESESKDLACHICETRRGRRLLKPKNCKMHRKFN